MRGWAVGGGGWVVGGYTPHLATVDAEAAEGLKHARVEELADLLGVEIEPRCLLRRALSGRRLEPLLHHGLHELAVHLLRSGGRRGRLSTEHGPSNCAHGRARGVGSPQEGGGRRRQERSGSGSSGSGSSRSGSSRSGRSGRSDSSGGGPSLVRICAGRTCAGGIPEREGISWPMSSPTPRIPTWPRG